MKTLSRTVVTPHRENGAAIINFVGYIHPTRPRLMRRTGWEIADDLHDDQADSFSEDNGKTWGGTRPFAQRRKVDGGYLFIQEGGAVYLPQRDLLVTITYETIQQSLDGYHNTSPGRLRITAANPERINDTPPRVSGFGVEHGIYVSFLHPLVDRAGRILAPAYFNQVEPNADGPLHKLGIPFRKDRPAEAEDYCATAVLIGTFDSNGALDWRLSPAVPCDADASARGLCEGSVAQLRDGTYAMVMRGSNHLWPDRPGCKWLSLSPDGENWSKATPLLCDDGTLIESSATGSRLFRSRKNGNLYWIGNLCVDGVRPFGWGANYPRTPLVVARVRENPVSLERASITVIDRQQPGESALVQMSNFRMYEDRETGDAVIYLTRYAERGEDSTRWLRADQYEYRVALD